MRNLLEYLSKSNIKLRIPQSIIFTRLNNSKTPAVVIPMSNINKYIRGLDDLYDHRDEGFKAMGVGSNYRIWNANVGGNNLGRANIVDKPISKWLKNLKSEYFLIWCTEPNAFSTHVSYFIKTTSNPSKYVDMNVTGDTATWNDILKYIESI